MKVKVRLKKFLKYLNLTKHFKKSSALRFISSAEIPENSLEPNTVSTSCLEKW